LNILITGDLSSLSGCLARKFQKEGHKVILAGSDPAIMTEKLRRVTFHKIAVDDVLFRKTLSRYRFDVVVFIGSREECRENPSALASGEMLDGLHNALELAKNEKSQHFLFISSTEIYGNVLQAEEDIEIDPISVNGYALASAEIICSHYQVEYSLGVTICRIPNIFGRYAGNGLLPSIVDQFRRKSKVNLPGSKGTTLSFLHCLDVADFILMILDQPASDGMQLFNLSSADPISLERLASQINDLFPTVVVQYDAEAKILTKPAHFTKAKEEYGWINKRTLEIELPELLAIWLEEDTPRDSILHRTGQFLQKLQPLVRWAELFLGAGAVYLLNNLTSTVLQFRYIDFRLLYVVLLGATHGTTMGLLAAVFASSLTLLSWFEAGMNFSMLIYNIENWIPFALYLLAGGITGYLHDKNENEVQFQKEQVDLVQEKYKFLYGVYDEISSIKDQFREQLMGYRDSFGRIYNVTTQLNSLQEEDIMLRALGVCEDVFENDSIALYSLDENKVFGRLQVCSQNLRTTLPKSIKLPDYPDLCSQIEAGEVYQNKDIKPGYPSYFAPVLDGKNPVAGIGIWEANFDQFSLQYLNLIKVISGLIQSALVRAALFKHINTVNLYLPNTRIFKPDAFKEILNAKKEMQTSQVAEYEMIRILSEIEDMEEASQLMESVIRSTDYIGLLDDGHCYILLSQTDWINAFNVLSRLHTSGVVGEICSEVVFDV